MTTIGIVCGYDDQASLRAYIERLAPEIAAVHPSFLVLTGGRTSPLLPDSEALVMSRLVQELCPGQPFVLEEAAMSTIENVLNAKQLAERTFGRVERWVVFCGQTHRRKVAALARLILGRGVRVIAVPRKVRLMVRLLEPTSLLIESAAALVPPLRRYVHAGALLWRGVNRRRRSVPPAAA
jgi:hypothetical protein